MNGNYSPTISGSQLRNIWYLGVKDFIGRGGGCSVFKGTVLGTPNREPQEYSRNIMEYKDPGRYIPIIYLLYSWGSRFGVPSRVPLVFGQSWVTTAVTFVSENRALQGAFHTLSKYPYPDPLGGSQNKIP